MKNSSLTILLFSFTIMISFGSGYSVGYVAQKEVTAQPMSCPFPLTTEEVQAPKVWRIATTTDQGPKG